MNSWFVAALAFLGLQRVVEMGYARYRARGLRAQGARFVQDDGMGAIVAVHAGLFVFAALEWYLAPWARIDAWSWIGVGLFIVGDAVRLWAIWHLGPRWNTRVYVLEGPLVDKGPYRWLRHPNYAGVVLVLLGFPLAFHLYGTAVMIGVANLLALRRRVRKEDAALGRSAPVTTGRARRS